MAEYSKDDEKQAAALNGQSPIDNNDESGVKKNVETARLAAERGHVATDKYASFSP